MSKQNITAWFSIFQSEPVRDKYDGLMLVNKYEIFERNES